MRQPLLPSNLVEFSLDLTHILNDIYNSNYYSLISCAVSPCGLIALLMSVPARPGREEFVMNFLEEFGFRAGINDDIDGLNSFFDEIVAEIDQSTREVFRTAGVATTPYFRRWWSQTQINIIASKDQTDENVLQEHSFGAARLFRLYDGTTSIARSAWIDIGAIE